MTMPDLITHPALNCVLCGRPGGILHPEVHDVDFGVPGSWRFRRCAAGDCGLVWLDPQPDPQSIPALYGRYYTHTEGDRPTPPAAAPPVALLRRLWSRSGPARRRRSMYLHDLRPGRLLEVGCGDGAKLEELRALGWTVDGIEPDPKAAAAAESRLGVPVHRGTVESLPADRSGYDAIILSHVIEHVPDAVSTLSRCRRLLRPGGRLVALTPNAASLSHQLFGTAWPGLDVPRHLRIYDRKTLRLTASRAGFADATVLQPLTNLRYMYRRSLEHRGIRPSAVRMGALLARACLWWLVRRQSAEECVLIAHGPASGAAGVGIKS